MRKDGLDALYLSNPHRIYYVTGCPYILITGMARPMGVVIPAEGSISLIVPKLELTQILDDTPTVVDEVVSYWEYPGTPHCLDTIAEVFRDKKLMHKTVGIDGSALPSIVGVYETESIQKKLPDVNFIPGKYILDDLRIIKSKEEIELIEEAAKWANLAHTYLQEFIKPGMSELEISSKATHYATTAMLKTLGSEYVSKALNWYTAWARFKAGPRTAYGHGLLKNERVKIGDNIETSASAMISGYSNHVERTMFLGEPNDKQKKYFDIMLKTQTAAIEAVKPGVPCSLVFKAAVDVVKDAGLDVGELIHNRVGHGMGLDATEPPFFVPHNDQPLKPGMVFTIEPGLKVRHYAAFRHCDTVLCTEDGHRILDFVPRDIESLTIKNY